MPGVDADREQHPGEFFDLSAQLRRFLIQGDGVQIDDAVDTIVVVLNPGPVLQRPQVIADMRAARGLDAGEDSCFHAIWGKLLS